MRVLWPGFECVQADDLVAWKGTLFPIQRQYLVGVIWSVTADRPWVEMIEPKLEPREGGTFRDIPHLMFNAEHPVKSGMCLFDPKLGEWSSNKLIAETTIPWAARWLRYYELWHFDGVWRGDVVDKSSENK